MPDDKADDKADDKVGTPRSPPGGALLLRSALVLNVVSFLASAIAYLVPFWWQSEVTPAMSGAENSTQRLATGFSDGWWARCYGAGLDECEWWPADGILPPGYRAEVWFVAALVLYSLGLLLHLVAVVATIVQITSCRVQTNYSIWIGGVLLCSFVLTGVSVIMYGIKLYEGKADTGYSRVTFSGSGPRVSWAFYVAAAGAVLTLGASIMYSCHSSPPLRAADEKKVEKETVDIEL